MDLTRIVVTGGTGFVGSRVVEKCRSAGCEVSSCSRSEGIDVRNSDAFGQFLRERAPHCVIHCAAHVGGIGYVAKHAVEVFEDNLAIATGLMRGMGNAGIDTLITVMPNCTYPGNLAVYREDQWWDGPMHESVLMYGLPRKALWGLCKAYGAKNGLRSAHLIFPNMYGPGDHFDPLRSHALGALVLRIVEAKREDKRHVELWGSGRPIREWMYVEDAASAIVKFLGAAENDQSLLDGHSILNVGIAEGITIADLAEMIREDVAWDGSFVFDHTKPDGAPRKLLDGTRFQELIGWRPTTSLRSGIKRTVESYILETQKEGVRAN